MIDKSIDIKHVVIKRCVFGKDNTLVNNRKMIDYWNLSCHIVAILR